MDEDADQTRAFIIDTSISLRHSAQLLPLMAVVQLPFARARFAPSSLMDETDSDVALGNLSLGAFWIREPKRWPWLKKMKEWLYLPGYLEWQSNLGLTVMLPTTTGDQEDMPRRALRRTRIMERGAYLADTWVFRPSYDWRVDFMAGIHAFLQAHFAAEVFVVGGDVDLSGRMALSVGGGNSWIAGAIEYMHHHDFWGLFGENELDIKGNQHILAATAHVRVHRDGWYGYSLRFVGYMRPNGDDRGFGIELGIPLSRKESAQ